MKSNGWVDELHLALCNFERTGRGIFAQNNVAKGGTLIQVPYKLMITVDILQNSEILDFLSSASKYEFQDLLSVFLAFEKHKKGYSKWAPYLDSLPTIHPSLPLFSHKHEIEMLSRPLKDAILKTRWKFERSWERISKSIKAPWLCLCCNKSVDCVLSFDLFTWGYVMVNTRAVYLSPQITSNDVLVKILSDEPSMALCPFLDMFNHSCSAKTEAKLTKKSQGSYYELVTETAYKKYEQVYISYGAHDNVKLLCEYGFFVPGNELDVIAFDMNEILRVLDISLSSKQYKFLIEKKFNNDLYIGVSGLSFNLRCLLYVCVEDDYTIWNSSIYGENYSEEHLKYMLQFAKKLLASKREYMNNTLKQLCGKHFSRHFLVVVDFLEYFKSFIERLECEIT